MISGIQNIFGKLSLYLIILFTIDGFFCTIQVKSPKELKNIFPNGIIQTSLSNFGMIPYGYKLLGKVKFYPEITQQDYACQQLPSVGDDHPVDESPIIMVHRGDCTFVTKVRNVEHAGGHVALIIDNTDESVDEIVMSDDGKGRSLTIPGVLISKKDGEILANYYKTNKNTDIILEVDFEMEHSSNTVNLEIFTTADNEMVYKLLNEFYFYYLNIKEHVNLTVHYVTYQHALYNNEPNAKNEIRENCLGNGRYCNSPGKFGTTDGRVIVKEAIYQKCIFLYSMEKSGSEDYWNYLNMFYNRCLNITSPTFTSECAASTTKILNLNSEKINKCVYDSYNTTSEIKNKENFEHYTNNKNLDDDNEDRQTYLLNFIPSININGRTFWGNWRPENIFEALCAGLQKKPEVCYDLGAFKKSSTLGWFSITLIILLVISINVVIFYFCKKYIRRKIVERIDSTDINHKINTVVTSYLALREGK